MKRLVFVLFLLLNLYPLTAQINIQLHHDLGSVLYPTDMEDRAKTITTVQMNKPDKWGSTFMMIDLEFSSNGIGNTFFKLSRKLSFWDGPWAVQVDYKGGHSNQKSFKNNYLIGGAYTINSKDHSRRVSFSALYKHIQKHDNPHNFQLSCVWSVPFLNRLCTFSGFADWGREKTRFGDYTALAKPQLWVNLNRIKGIDEKFNLSVGSVSEVIYNIGHDGFYWVPAVSVKWTFD